jgi:hypothetical protein
MLIDHLDLGMWIFLLQLVWFPWVSLANILHTMYMPSMSMNKQSHIICQKGRRENTKYHGTQIIFQSPSHKSIFVVVSNEIILIVTVSYWDRMFHFSLGRLNLEQNNCFFVTELAMQLLYYCFWHRFIELGMSMKNLRWNGRNLL